MKFTREQIEAMSREDKINFLRGADELEERQRTEYCRYFKPYESRRTPGYYPQLDILTAPTKVRIAEAGNRAGKTIAEMMDCIMTVEKRHPTWDPVKGKVKELPPGKNPIDMFPVDFDAPVNDKTPIRARLCSLDFDFIEDVHIPMLQSLVVRSHLRGGIWDSAWDKAHNKLHWKDRSYLQFKSFESPPTKFGGATLHWVGHDETCKDYNIWLQNFARTAEVRGRLMITLTHIKGRTSWEFQNIIAKADENPEISKFNMAILDNPYIPEDEIEKLAYGMSEDEYRTIILGEAVSLGGLVYPHFNRDVHIVPNEPIPANWPKFLFCDPHEGKPTVFIWIAVSPYYEPLQDYYVYRELFTNKGIEQQVDMVRHLTAGECLAGKFCDSRMNKTNRLVGGVNYFEEYEKYGLDFMPTKNDPGSKEPGIQLVKDALRCRFETKKPRLLFMQDTLENDPGLYVSTIKGSRAAWECESYSYRDPDMTDKQMYRELTVDKDDDAITLTRYGLMEKLDLSHGIGKPFGAQQGGMTLGISPDGRIYVPNAQQIETFGQKQFWDYH